MNGTPFPHAIPSASASEGAPLLQGKQATGALQAWWFRVVGLSRNKPPALNFALILFFGISLQQSLILNLGPTIFQVRPPHTTHSPSHAATTRISDSKRHSCLRSSLTATSHCGTSHCEIRCYQRPATLFAPSLDAAFAPAIRAASALGQELLYPGEKSGLPYSVLLGWNCADWVGILIAVLVIDRMGRRNFFIVGFVMAGVAWACFGAIRPIITAASTTADPLWGLIVLGAVAQATRGYSPIAGNLWALESFPTEQRATCYSACNVVYQLTATILVPVASSFESAPPVTLVMVYAGLQVALGVFTFFLPNETTNKALT